MSAILFTPLLLRHLPLGFKQECMCVKQSTTILCKSKSDVKTSDYTENEKSKVPLSLYNFGWRVLVLIFVCHNLVDIFHIVFLATYINIAVHRDCKTQMTCYLFQTQVPFSFHSVFFPSCSWTHLKNARWQSDCLTCSIRTLIFFGMIQYLEQKEREKKINKQNV